MLLHLYEEHGERMVEHLRGMFAFALHDRPRRRLLLARDRLGKKPLYYAHAQGRFLFAGEAKAIRAALDSKDLDGAKNALRATVSIIDRMATKGIIHRNTAGRYKSRIVKRINSKAARA